MLLAARWRAALKQGPRLLAVTIDHGLRPESAAEARAVKELAHKLGLTHRTMRWEGRKPATGLQEAARQARYRLLATAAASAKADHIVTAHTLDDQAETVLIRMSRGSGVTGLGAMAYVSPLPVAGACDVTLVRPLLDVPKLRLITTLARAGIAFAQDASNRDPRFTRVRLRELMPALAREGLDARRLGALARRLRRADAAIEAAVDAAAQALTQEALTQEALTQGAWTERGPITFAAEKFARLPVEVALRLLGRAIARTGDEGPVELGKLEALHQALTRSSQHRSPQQRRLRRTLGGALVTLQATTLVVERAPARRAKASRRAALTTGAFAACTARNGGRMR
jgi:tRNA(Ile)-lysidine synthase